ncbi:hypothetical protein GCM10025868_25740 [Angustibacter aerolatus]|uniref:Uncharacterized protein n=1 Tax=Angustibacter aerolatus TaxID=1162965 RepID=A0ABQ6JIZ0_9ACTN|nr:hypothetical protein GCM10025868_25740 [Angustibacter aerolatus]
MPDVEVVPLRIVRHACEEDVRVCSRTGARTGAVPCSTRTVTGWAVPTRTRPAVRTLTSARAVVVAPTRTEVVTEPLTPLAREVSVAVTLSVP